MKSGLERIAFASSAPSMSKEIQRNHGRVTRARWTELSVFYNHDEARHRKPWVARSRGLSTYPGEVVKETELRSGTLARALSIFDDTQVGRSARAQAEEWEEQQAIPVLPPASGVELLPREAFTGSTQDAALRWLYGDELEKRKPAGLVAADFLIGESSVRMALEQGRDIRIPLTAAVRFFDLSRFRSAREARDA